MPLDLDLATAFYSPTPPADAAAGASRYPDSVLLDRKAYFDDRDNATTAVGETSTGHTIKITFCLADPPAVSYFCIHSPGLEDTHTGVPVVACSDKDLVVIHFSFNCQPGFHECFIYRAGHGKKPSFKRIPYPGPGIFVRERILRDDSIGVVPFPSSGGDGELLLVSLTMRSLLDYDVHIFSSKTEQWTTKRVPVQTKPNLWEDDVPHDFTKVITLGGGVLGWVDLRRGILVCNVLELEQDPVLRIIQLPKPRCQASQYHSIKVIRDVTCNNGLIKFIDMEHLYRQVIVHDKMPMPMQMQNDPGSTDIIHDSDLARQNDVREAAPAPKLGYVPDGWMLRSYYRHTSWDYWRMECILHCDDISIHNPRHYMLLPKLRC